MEKIMNTTKILMRPETNVKAPIYNHEGKFYIKVTKDPKTESLHIIEHEGQKYSEVHKVANHWFFK